MTSSPFAKGIHPEGFFLKEIERDFERVEKERGGLSSPLTLILSHGGERKHI
jgi:hypothetical protein